MLSHFNKVPSLQHKNLNWKPNQGIKRKKETEKSVVSNFNKKDSQSHEKFVSQQDC